ncbi:unknown [[Mannheimia] succiniciproducens MBEL55E]|uniref:LysR substrate-binding domain-containing protein n=1 Tax=Mannheimia succiniciproducens (strain KCTC 0769BP / MBEL55E) TaxID=221988 RepID=Q65SM3_MANSM|nr:unknown [[Mannheimia] succiniciproducens MBEL55E]
MNPTVVVSNIKTLLLAVLSGRIFAPVMQHDCQPYLDSGELEIVFPNLESQMWGIYLYRPYQTITPKRVLVVFEILERLLKMHSEQ